MPVDARTAALTGGIASGKSTVSRMFRECGAHIVDADVVAREVVEPGQPAWQDIVEHFGETILLDDKHLNRPALGRIIFEHPDKRNVLNQIVHPRVRDEMQRQHQAIRRRHPHDVIIMDIPLLIEVGQQNAYQIVIVVYVSETTQLHRLMQRNQFSEEAARQRLQAQMPLEQKCAYATHVIHNEHSRDVTQGQVQEVYQKILNNKKDNKYQ